MSLLFLELTQHDQAASRTNEEEDIFEINMKATKMAKHGGAGNKENSANRATDNTDKRDNSRSASSDDASIDSSEDENLPSPLKRLFKDTSQKTARVCHVIQMKY